VTFRCSINYVRVDWSRVGQRPQLSSCLSVCLSVMSHQSRNEIKSVSPERVMMTDGWPEFAVAPRRCCVWDSDVAVDDLRNDATFDY